ncbi:MAG TPA: hypothetical protein VKT72_04045 [Candidatus Baltobacteraceae bacterium]|nr:hypothetical protein [Candidatus Baltobacteraceae bacterium]
MTALRAFITIGLALLWLVLFAPPMFQTPPAVYTGVNLVQTGAPIQQNIIRVDPGSPAYLVRGVRCHRLGSVCGARSGCGA